MHRCPPSLIVLLHATITPSCRSSRRCFDVLLSLLQRHCTVQLLQLRAKLVRDLGLFMHSLLLVGTAPPVHIHQWLLAVSASVLPWYLLLFGFNLLNSLRSQLPGCSYPSGGRLLTPSLSIPPLIGGCFFRVGDTCFLAGIDPSTTCHCLPVKDISPIRLSHPPVRTILLTGHPWVSLPVRGILLAGPHGVCFPARDYSLTGHHGVCLLAEAHPPTGHYLLPAGGNSPTEPIDFPSSHHIIS